MVYTDLLTQTPCRLLPTTIKQAGHAHVLCLSAIQPMLFLARITLMKRAFLRMRCRTSMPRLAKTKMRGQLVLAVATFLPKLFTAVKRTAAHCSRTAFQRISRLRPAFLEMTHSAPTSFHQGMSKTPFSVMQQLGAQETKKSSH